MAATAMVLAPGATLAGYRIGDVIGIGGMAIVYRAEQISLGRPVALKVLSPKLSGGEAFRERFRREGKHIAALDHPHIVSVFDSGEVDGQLFLAMRLVEGTTLAERIHDRGLSADETLRILRPIADALDAAHAAGLVHRDIKPQNILLAHSGYPYLADFGVAKGGQSVDLTATGGFVGSFNYAAPEQFLSEQATAATDVYALTAVVFHCLTGRVPYPRDTDISLINAHVNEPPPSVLAGLPAGSAFNEMIARGMAKGPARRYERASSVLAATAAVAGELTAEQRSAVPTFKAAGGQSRGESSVITVTPAPPATPEIPATTAAAAGTEPATRPASGPSNGSDWISRYVPNGTAEGNETVVVPAEKRGNGRLADDLTAPARLRPVTEPESESAQPSKPLRRAVLFGVLAAVSIAVVALVALATGGGSGRTALLAARSGPVTIGYRSPWRTTSRAVAGSSAFHAPARLASGSSTLAAGLLAESATVPGDPPPRLVALYGKPASSASVDVAGDRGRRYRWMLPHSAQLVAYVIPTTSADIAIVCDSPQTPADAAASCENLAVAAMVAGVTVLPPGPDTTLARALTRSLSPVATARHNLSGLKAGQLVNRASAATAIAQAETKAVAALSRLNVPARYKVVVSKLTHAIKHEATSFRSLSTAARNNSDAAYRVASRGVEAASRAVASASRAVKADALAVPTLGRLTIPAPPSAPTRTVPTTTTPTTTTPTTTTPTGTTPPGTTTTPPAPTTIVVGAPAG